jgi:hypothetical protein
VSLKSRDPSELNAHLERLAQLLWIGGTQIAILAKGDQKITFELWSKDVREATRKQRTNLTDGQLKWLWEALTTEPGILREFATQIRFLEDEWKDRPTVTVLNSAHILGNIFEGLNCFWCVGLISARKRSTGR